eukprot:CAMPEP_0194556864 /NCGR_PEP_ID=MMETSP0253-20130528/98958_1 /TAXON_ID=2966 /ORGANISM="Noctiluca scintillans" /LENGTH=177 /DNA_ID=CAMNT_0039404369 /DNA_START=657 /DNA_END=1190 /DNA_ORIENTATION=-
MREYMSAPQPSSHPSGERSTAKPENTGAYTESTRTWTVPKLHDADARVSGVDAGAHQSSECCTGRLCGADAPGHTNDTERHEEPYNNDKYTTPAPPCFGALRTPKSEASQSFACMPGHAPEPLPLFGLSPHAPTVAMTQQRGAANVANVTGKFCVDFVRKVSMCAGNVQQRIEHATQ